MIKIKYEITRIIIILCIYSIHTSIQYAVVTIYNIYVLQCHLHTLTCSWSHSSTSVCSVRIWKRHGCYKEDLSGLMLINEFSSKSSYNLIPHYNVACEQKLIFNT